MKTIVAIGGGELKELETLPIDQKIVSLTRKKHPRALFIPTASGDAQGYWETFQEVYGENLGCQTDVLFLVREKPSADVIFKKIDSADLIYVGGGNTFKMMRAWRKAGVDKLLRTAYESGTIMSGLSAGAICWFNYGCSDSPRFFKNSPSKSYMRVRGLGLVHGLFCPHYVFEHREEDFNQMVMKYGEIGYAADNGVAFIACDDEITVIKVGEMSTARILRREKGILTISDL